MLQRLENRASFLAELSGALADQALGRILDLERRRDPTAEREIAARSIAKHPNGTDALPAPPLVSP